MFSLCLPVLQMWLQFPMTFYLGVAQSCCTFLPSPQK
jgi:hypothetical protein